MRINQSRQIFQEHKKSKKISINKKTSYICSPKICGIIAQLVEQRTENPCVAGSIPADTTLK